jgi:hypothetical protein
MVNEKEEIINSAVEYGLGVLAENHPLFPQEYIQGHINTRALKEKMGNISNELKKETSLSPEQRREYLHRELADYIAEGGAFDKRAKKAVLVKNGLEEKASKWYNFKAKRKLEGEKKFEDTIEAFRDLYSLFKTGDYAQRMPELAQAVQEVYNNGFFDPAMDILNSYGLINTKKYDLIKKSIRIKTKNTSEAVVQGIEHYFYPEAAIVIMGLVGALMVFTSVNMTGGVIGVLGSQNIKVIGAFLCLVALGSFLMIIKKKNRLKTLKNK